MVNITELLRRITALERKNTRLEQENMRIKQERAMAVAEARSRHQTRVSGDSDLDIKTSTASSRHMSRRRSTRQRSRLNHKSRTHPIRDQFVQYDNQTRAATEVMSHFVAGVRAVMLFGLTLSGKSMALVISIDRYVMRFKDENEAFGEALRRLVRLVTGHNESKLHTDMTVLLCGFFTHLHPREFQDEDLVSFYRPNLTCEETKGLLSSEEFPTGLIVTDEGHIATQQNTGMDGLLRDVVGPDSSHHWLVVSATPDVVSKNIASWKQKGAFVFLEPGVGYKGVEYFVDTKLVAEAVNLADPVIGPQAVVRMREHLLSTWTTHRKITLIRTPKGDGSLNVSHFLDSAFRRRNTASISFPQGFVELDSQWEAFCWLALASRSEGEINRNKNSADSKRVREYSKMNTEKRMECVKAWTIEMWDWILNQLRDADAQWEAELDISDFISNSTDVLDCLFDALPNPTAKRNLRVYVQALKGAETNPIPHSVLKYDSDHKDDISELNTYLWAKEAPDVHILALAKDLLRCGHNFPKRHVAIFYDTDSGNSNSVPQSFIGRASRYSKTHDEWGEGNPEPFIYTNLKVIHEYLEQIKSLKHCKVNGAGYTVGLDTAMRTPQMRIDEDQSTKIRRHSLAQPSNLSHATPEQKLNANLYESQNALPIGKRMHMFKTVITTRVVETTMTMNESEDESVDHDVSVSKHPRSNVQEIGRGVDSASDSDSESDSMEPDEFKELASPRNYLYPFCITPRRSITETRQLLEDDIKSTWEQIPYAKTSKTRPNNPRMIPTYRFSHGRFMRMLGNIQHESVINDLNDSERPYRVVIYPFPLKDLHPLHMVFYDGERESACIMVKQVWDETRQEFIDDSWPRTIVKGASNDDIRNEIGYIADEDGHVDLTKKYFFVTFFQRWDFRR
jgi:hypothetical protein